MYIFVSESGHMNCSTEINLHHLMKLSLRESEPSGSQCLHLSTTFLVSSLTNVTIVHKDA